MFRNAFLICALAAAPLAAQSTELPLRDGDRVLVKLWADSVFADSARVAESGSLVLARLGPLSIAGVPATQVADSVRRAYGRVLRALTVEVTPLRRVTVMGEVRRPSVYYLDIRSSFRDAIAMAQGITEIGRSNRLTLIRDDVESKVKNWQSRMGDSGLLHSGDVLIVDREPWLKRNAFTALSGLSILLSVAITVARL